MIYCILSILFFTITPLYHLSLFPSYYSMHCSLDCSFNFTLIIPHITILNCSFNCSLTLYSNCPFSAFAPDNHNSPLPLATIFIIPSDNSICSLSYINTLVYSGFLFESSYLFLILARSLFLIVLLGYPLHASYYLCPFLT